MITKQNRTITILIGILVAVVTLAAISIFLVRNSGAGLSQAEIDAQIADQVSSQVSQALALTPTVPLATPGPQLAVPVEEQQRAANVIPDQGSSRQHIVIAGDTLGGIASQYSVTVEGLMSVNGISDQNMIFIGQTLKIPESVSTYSGSSTFQLTGAQFPVYTTILGPVGYAKQADEQKLAWPGTWEEVARPKFEHINGEAVWRSQDVLPGETALYVGSGFNSPVGHFVGCSAGWFRNDTNQTITVWVLSMTEIVVGNSDNYDGMAQELAKRTSSGNQCTTSYLGQIPLH